MKFFRDYAGNKSRDVGIFCIAHFICYVKLKNFGYLFQSHNWRRHFFGRWTLQRWQAFCQTTCSLATLLSNDRALGCNQCKHIRTTPLWWTHGWREKIIRRIWQHFYLKSLTLSQTSCSLLLLLLQLINLIRFRKYSNAGRVGSSAVVVYKITKTHVQPCKCLKRVCTKTIKKSKKLTFTLYVSTHVFSFYTKL